VWANGLPPPPLVTSSPVVTGKPDESAQGFPGVFTACAVTRAMCRVESESNTDPEDGGARESEVFSVDIPEFFLSVSRSDLLVEQRADPSLSQLFDQVLTV